MSPAVHQQLSTTGQENAFLREYVFHHGEIDGNQTFESQYMQRFQNANAEAHYKTSLSLAQVWQGRVEEGFQAGIAYNTLRATALPNKL